MKNIGPIISKFLFPKINSNDKTSQKQKISEKVFVTRRFLGQKFLNAQK